jgi:Uma2 family endonuclease
MTAEPLSVPSWMRRTLTVADYCDLGETDPGYTELVEGRLSGSPSPSLDHNLAASALREVLTRHAPPEVVVVLDVDLDLRLTPPDRPGFVRRPDLLVAHASARRRIRETGGLLHAGEVLLVVEFVSPSSHRTDHVVKRSEYADAGIPHYWIVDLGERVTLTTCHLGGEFGYVDSGPLSGRVAVTEPLAVDVDLDRLL